MTMENVTAAAFIPMAACLGAIQGLVEVKEAAVAGHQEAEAGLEGEAFHAPAHVPAAPALAPVPAGAAPGVQEKLTIPVPCALQKRKKYGKIFNVFLWGSDIFRSYILQQQQAAL